MDNSARKLGVEIVLIWACLDVIVELPAEPAAPRIGLDRWVTIAEYIPPVTVYLAFRTKPSAGIIAEI